MSSPLEAQSSPDHLHKYTCHTIHNATTPTIPWESSPDAPSPDGDMSTMRAPRRGSELRGNQSMAAAVSSALVAAGDGYRGRATMRPVRARGRLPMARAVNLQLYMLSRVVSQPRERSRTHRSLCACHSCAARVPITAVGTYVVRVVSPLMALAVACLPLLPRARPRVRA